MEPLGALITQIVTLAGAATSLVLATMVLRAPHRRLAQWSFSAGMLGFAVESLAAFMLLTRTDAPGDRLLWLHITQSAGLVLPLPWMLFTAGLVYPKGAQFSGRRRLALVAAGALALGGTAAVLAFPLFLVPDFSGLFYAARLEPLGRAVGILQLLATVAILVGLEAALRASTGVTRWRIKYLILGLGGIFLARFYLLSNVLLFQVVMAVYMVTAAAILSLGNLVITASLTRDRLLDAEVVVSRRMVYRSVVIGALGLYLFLVGGLGWLSNHLGIQEGLFWGSLIVFASAVGVAVVLLSEDARWRLKRFLNRHFYRYKYDYRDQWMSFTNRLGSLLTVDELAPQLLNAVSDTIGATRGALYLVDERDGHYHLAAALGPGRHPATIDGTVPLLVRLAAEPEPVLIEASDVGDGHAAEPVANAPSFDEGSIAVPLRWRGTLTGMMLVGRERTGVAYVSEDFEFLATVGTQAAGALVTARLSENVAQAREFEAFHRLTSFVIHDLKNSISALSMLSENAVKHFDDPEFQRDAIRTVSRTAERMRGLMTRLSSAPEHAQLKLEPVDLNALVTEATTPVRGRTDVSLVTALGPVPAVLGDTEALLRVVQNLITNAVEALDGRGTLTVSTVDAGRTVALEVSDTGCGMSEEFIRKSLFAPFRSTKKGGWGIGLYQAKGIVEGHGGGVEVASTLGAGTTFRVTLPIHREGAGGGRA